MEVLGPFWGSLSPVVSHSLATLPYNNNYKVYNIRGHLLNLFDFTKKTSCTDIEPRHGRVIMSKENRKPPSGVGERETIENLRVFLICWTIERSCCNVNFLLNRLLLALFYYSEIKVHSRVILCKIGSKVSISHWTASVLKMYLRPIPPCHILVMCWPRDREIGHVPLLPHKP